MRPSASGPINVIDKPEPIPSSVSESFHRLDRPSLRQPQPSTISANPSTDLRSSSGLVRGVNELRSPSGLVRGVNELRSPSGLVRSQASESLSVQASE